MLGRRYGRYGVVDCCFVEYTEYPPLFLTQSSYYSDDNGPEFISIQKRNGRVL
jgi:hypothetical protein